MSVVFSTAPSISPHKEKLENTSEHIYCLFYSIGTYEYLIAINLLTGGVVNDKANTAYLESLPESSGTDTVIVIKIP